MDENFFLVKLTPEMEEAEVLLAAYRAKLLAEHQEEFSEACLDRYLKALERYQVRRLTVSRNREVPEKKWSADDQRILGERLSGLRHMQWVLGLKTHEWATLNHYMIRKIFPARRTESGSDKQ